MSPSELEEYILFEPRGPIRLTLSSGDQIIVYPDETPLVEGLVLVLRGEPKESGRATNRGRLISIPNIALAEPYEPRGGAARRSRR